MRRRTLLLYLAIHAAAANAQQTHPATGRQIAPVMGMGGADWLTRPERIAEEDPERALDAIGLRKGDVVADIGAGVGYFSWRMAERVGPAGKIYSNDIQPEMLDQLKENVAAHGLANVIPVLGTESDPKLPPGALDLALLVDVYHEFSQPQKMLAGIRAALKPSGRLVLLEYRKEDPSVPIRREHKMTVKEVRAEIEPEGFRFETSLETLPRQHILIFRPARLPPIQ
jgi:predicted methyltransferase